MIMNFGKRGGSAVASGTYWNFETGEKLKLDRSGVLPGGSSQTFVTLPPLLILAITAAAAHIVLYILPTYLVQFYEAYTDKLVTAYVIFDYIAIGVILCGLAGAATGDIFAVRRKVPAFTWNPGEAHLAGKRAKVPVRIDDDIKE